MLLYPYKYSYLYKLLMIGACLSMGWLTKFFDIKGRGTTYGTEFRAGMTTFMTMAYIIIVQPAIMSASGMPVEAVFTATVLLCGAATLVMGIYSRLPFAMAPAMGLNALFAYTMVAGGVMDWQTALGVIFLAGVLFGLLSFPIFKPLKLFGVKNEAFTNYTLRRALTDNLPVSIKLGLAAVVGIFLLGLGLGGNGIGLTAIVNGSQTFGNVADPTVLIGVVGFLLTGILFWAKGKLHVPGALLIGIFLVTIATIVFGIVPLPAKVFSLPPSMAAVSLKVNILGALKLKYLPYVLIFLLGNFLSTVGTTLACGTKAGLIDEKGDMAGLSQVYQVDSIFAMAGAAFGVTTLTTYVESAAGIEEGGRTGFTSIVTALFFFAALLFSPIFLMIPSVATGVALVVVGLSMLQELRLIDFTDPVQWVPVMVMVVTTAFSMDFATAMCAGIIVYSVFAVLYRYVLKDKTVKVNAMTAVLFLIAIAQFAITV
jgi:AGZA family xanthine/uracil permease-like MFS transporter